MTLQLLLSLLYVCVLAESKCSQQDVLNHLNLSTNQEHVAMTRPGQDSGTPTVVELDVLFSNIQAVDEKSQTFTPYIWIFMTWTNEVLSWQPEQFCEIEEVSVPRELLWKPDLMILEMLEMERDMGTRQGSRNVQLSSNGTLTMTNYRKVTADCAMDVYKFPFDSQSCNLTFTSYHYSDEELQLVTSSNSSFSDELLYVGEWELLNISVITEKTSYPGVNWDNVVYTISIRRVPLLYVLTFILPILFLLLLDVASFLMSDAQGQKTGFKVTVLLAMSVMLLVLKDMLPNKPRRTPLIAVYVVVTFGFMLLSLMESILVGYLLERADTKHSQATGNRKSVGGIICVANGECQQEATPMTGRPDPAERDDPVHLQGGDPVPLLLHLIHQDLQKQNLLLQNRNLEPLRNQNSLVRYINTTFFILYLLFIFIFLPTLFITWVY